MNDLVVKIRLLWVEDQLSWADPYARLMLKPEALKSHYDFDIKIVETLAAARRAVAVETFHVILLDLGLPDSTTESTVEALPELVKVWSPTPIVVITGSVTADLNQKCIALGADNFLHKPAINSATGVAHAVTEIVKTCVRHASKA